MTLVRPFAFDRLPRLSRDTALAMRAEARGGPLAALVRGARRAGEWLGAPTHVEVGLPSDASPAPVDGIFVLFEDGAGARAALALDAAMASIVVDRTVGGEGLDGAAGPLTDIERGVLAYAIARWIAPFGSRFAVAAVLTSGAALAEALGAYRSWPLTVRVGESIGGASLRVPPHATEDAPRRLPAWARSIPVELAVTAGEATLAARTVTGLEHGDVVVPDGCGLRLEEGALAGHVRLEHTSGAWTARLTDDSVEVIDAEPRGPTRGREVKVMDSTPQDDDERALARMGDTPVTLTIELARLALPLSELAALAPGEVLRTGTPIGARVALRAGDQIIAEGELVDVEGELGVRITDLRG